ncbi:hypothetical protein PSPTOT1_1975 [Pseudomonas syringae pv. tomato T1]|nr:hypothetical protein PSPTOT1_1975 [Pseudomonas syringae pv. tomato T1]
MTSSTPASLASVDEARATRVSIMVSLTLIKSRSNIKQPALTELLSEMTATACMTGPWSLSWPHL